MLSSYMQNTSMQVHYLSLTAGKPNFIFMFYFTTPLAVSLKPNFIFMFYFTAPLAEAPIP